MKGRFTLFIMLIVGLANAQDKKAKAKKRIMPKDSVYAFQFVPKANSGDSLILNMPVDSLPAGNVKMPNSYRRGLFEPVPMPTHRVKIVKIRKTTSICQSSPPD